jgi:alanine-glyoxylate transaminase / serine-glyoxylate transaminase / serine-pyruvate transaminase
MTERILLGPGPSPISPRVLRALAMPVMSHLDPQFLVLMDDTMALLRQVFLTANRLTLPLSATGSGGMEAALMNLLEPGDRLVLCQAGYFAQRMDLMARRIGARVRTVEAPLGMSVDPADVERAVRESPTKLVACVHVETSTGVIQDLPPLAAIAHRYGALFLVDTVASLGGVPLCIDAWGIDVSYAGSQKCLSAPPGLAPVTFSDTTKALIGARRSPPASWYLDISLLSTYWGSERVYHHTAPVNLIYALREALRQLLEEGLEASWSRHARHARALRAGLTAMGLQLLVSEPQRAPTVTVIHIPEGVSDVRVRHELLHEYGLDIGGGLGPLHGRVWRIGLMGEGCRATNILLLLAALDTVLDRAGHRHEPGAAVAAAAQALHADRSPDNSQGQWDTRMAQDTVAR